VALFRKRAQSLRKRLERPRASVSAA
jgi:hypothetical protein